jgi:hypothetical protein
MMSILRTNTGLALPHEAANGFDLGPGRLVSIKSQSTQVLRIVPLLDGGFVFGCAICHRRTSCCVNVTSCYERRASGALHHVQHE